MTPGKIIAQEAWNMIPDECKEKMKDIKSSFIKSIASDIDYEIDKIKKIVILDIINLNKQFLYKKTKSLYNGKLDDWRYLDFFKDEEIGFQEFLSKFDNDPDYKNLNLSKILNNDELDSLAYEILEKINSVSELEIAQNFKK